MVELNKYIKDFDKILRILGIANCIRIFNFKDIINLVHQNWLHINISF